MQYVDNLLYTPSQHVLDGSAGAFPHRHQTNSASSASTRRRIIERHPSDGSGSVVWRPAFKITSA